MLNDRLRKCDVTLDMSFQYFFLHRYFNGVGKLDFKESQKNNKTTD